MNTGPMIRLKGMFLYWVVAFLSCIATTNTHFSSPIYALSAEVVSEGEIPISSDLFISTYFKQSSQNMYEVLRYGFPDVSGDSVNNLYQIFVTLAEIETLDDVFSQELLMWWRGLKSSDIVGFKISHEEHLRLKSAPILSEINIPVSQYLDIGSGNCDLTRAIGSSLGASICALDVAKYRVGRPSDS